MIYLNILVKIYNMKPINNKSLLHFLYNQMEKLDEKIISVEEAKAQASLAKQVTNVYDHEIKRAKVNLELAKHNKDNDRQIIIRDIEGVNFD